MRVVREYLGDLGEVENVNLKFGFGDHGSAGDAVFDERHVTADIPGVELCNGLTTQNLNRRSAAHHNKKRGWLGIDGDNDFPRLVGHSAGDGAEHGPVVGGEVLKFH